MEGIFFQEVFTDRCLPFVIVYFHWLTFLMFQLIIRKKVTLLSYFDHCACFLLGIADSSRCFLKIILNNFRVFSRLMFFHLFPFIFCLPTLLFRPRNLKPSLDLWIFSNLVHSSARKISCHYDSMLAKNLFPYWEFKALFNIFWHVVPK